MAWKKFAPRSYQKTTLFLLFLVPPLLFVKGYHWRIFLEWLFFTSLTLRMVFLATRRPLDERTPRKVYGWFWFVHQVSFAGACAGYAGAVLFGFLFPMPMATQNFLAALMVDSLYVGVLNRDVAEIIAERMSVSMGFAPAKDDDAKGFLPNRNLDPNVCVICSLILQKPVLE